ncbi:general substrate transporter [Neocallimastix lanati (nom. inval.)]|jgi:sugar porter (SP) family MFS transporter|uniref:General substrate transporter n=1 Tax=Neocallimastix californiae TaxID=1754190 RepID=A0A1Y2DCT6_9FUNG|nr:general substrate transporter [Neocallimastix sp. JGI-2020a]ORY57083.1 general substrate transporter [Neocallimastix californiae]|eukprot:ORY57083.1 general substrate transporter [Neocallimastix californiae]
MGKLEYINKRLFFYVIICGIGSIVYGWEVGMLNIIFSMRASFGKQFGMYYFDPKAKAFLETDDKTFREMIITPSFTVGSICGAIVVLYLMDNIGRIKSLRIGSIIYLIGSLIQVFGGNVLLLCIGRFIAGIASGIALCLCPLYIAEVAPKQIRGTLGIVNALGLQVGMLLASLHDTLCLKLITKNMTAQWKVALGGLLIPAVFFVILVWFLPETPRYLLMKNKDDRALKNLAKIREKGDCHPAVVEEFNEMNTRLKVELSEGMVTWGEMFRTKNILYRVIVVCLLQMLHMLVGVNAIGYYSTQIYSKYLGISLAQYGAWLTVLNNLISFLLTLPAMKYIENFGRKPILKWGAFLLGICMIGIFAMCLLVDTTNNKAFGWICVVIMYCFTIIYGWSWSSVVFVFQAEVFPIRMRAKANCLGSIAQCIGSIMVTSPMTTIMKYLKYYTFLIFAAFCFISFIFASVCIRETKGLSLEEMEHLYGSSKTPAEKKLEQDLKEKKIRNNVEA